MQKSQNFGKGISDDAKIISAIMRAAKADSGALTSILLLKKYDEYVLENQLSAVQRTRIYR